MIGNLYTKRYFVVEKICGECDDLNELALCYYKNDQCTDPNGWFFLSDVKKIEEERKISKDMSDHSLKLNNNGQNRYSNGHNDYESTFDKSPGAELRRLSSDSFYTKKNKKKSKTKVQREKHGYVIIIHHPSRIFRLEAPTYEQHQVWISGLSAVCGIEISKDYTYTPSKQSLSRETLEHPRDTTDVVLRSSSIVSPCSTRYSAASSPLSDKSSRINRDDDKLTAQLKFMRTLSKKNLNSDVATSEKDKPTLSDDEKENNKENTLDENKKSDEANSVATSKPLSSSTKAKNSDNADENKSGQQTIAKNQTESPSSSSSSSSLSTSPRNAKSANHGTRGITRRDSRRMFPRQTSDRGETTTARLRRAIQDGNQEQPRESKQDTEHNQASSPSVVCTSNTPEDNIGFLSKQKSQGNLSNGNNKSHRTLSSSCSRSFRELLGHTQSSSSNSLTLQFRNRGITLVDSDSDMETEEDSRSDSSSSIESVRKLRTSDFGHNRSNQDDKDDDSLSSFDMSDFGFIQEKSQQLHGGRKTRENMFLTKKVEETLLDHNCLINNKKNLSVSQIEPSACESNDCSKKNPIQVGPAADQNFTTEDWDEDLSPRAREVENNVTTLKESHFIYEDWDEE